MKTVLLLLTFGSALSAQNSDIGLLVGGTIPNSQGAINGSTITGSQTGGVSYQISYAWQFHGWHAVDLHLEIPAAGYLGPSSGTVAPGIVTGSVGRAVFLTPGVRFMFHVQRRVSLYAATGFGAAWLNTFTATVAQSVTSTSRTTTHPAGELGGGIDVRLSRLLSLRGETRDFITSGTLAGAVARNHALFQFGIGLHF
jgi:hypothetical protein